jgi:O-antigen ligase
MLSQIRTNNYKSITTNVLFCLFPLTSIIGNLFINLNIIFLFSATFFFYAGELKNFKLNLFDKIITFFFIYIFFSLALNYSEYFLNNKELPFEIIKKSFLYLRYYFLYIALRILMHHDILKLKWFYISASFFVIFTCVNIFFQYFFLVDMLGNLPVTSRRLSGFFGDELIAGGYIQRFSLFAIFLTFIFNFKKKFNPYLITFIIIFILMFGIILSGNKMPLILFLFSLFLFFLLNMSSRKKILLFFIFSLISLPLIYKQNSNFRNDVSSFHKTTKALIDVFYFQSQTLEESINFYKTPYILEFYAAHLTWKKNIYFGGGIKSFRFNCPNCNTHPHNYYLEVFVDLGLFGFCILGIFLFYIFYKIYKIKHIFYSSSILGQKTLTFFIIFFTEFFPFRSTGSFFSTNNASFIFLVLALLVSLIAKSDNKRIN